MNTCSIHRQLANIYIHFNFKQALEKSVALSQPAQHTYKDWVVASVPLLLAIYQIMRK